MASFTKLFFLITLFTVVLNSCNTESFEKEEDIERLKLICNEATENLQTASVAFINASATDPNYVLLCNTYKEALQNQIIVCGDNERIYQETIDKLDCDNPKEDNNGVNTFFARIDGSEFFDEQIINSVASSAEEKILTIEALKSTKESISITLDLEMPPGVYEFKTSGFPSAFYNESFSGELNILKEGQLTIISNNPLAKNITGTFEFNAVPEEEQEEGEEMTIFSITEGRFNVTYP